MVIRLKKQVQLCSKTQWDVHIHFVACRAIFPMTLTLNPGQRAPYLYQTS